MQLFTIKTLGCKVNQYESERIRERLTEAGLAEAREEKESHLFIINTCTVTGESDRKSRNLVRKLHRLNPFAGIVVTGCYVERDRNEIESLERVDLILSNHEKDDILARLIEKGLIGLRGGSETVKDPRGFTISRFEGHSRAFVKAQDGCDQKCSYCKVSLVRGPLKSRDAGDIIKEVRKLVDNGYREIVLTGIKLGSYGRELRNGTDLLGLIKEIAKIDRLERIRLSSIEPNDVSDRLIDLIAAEDKLCKHLHIPFQSGDDAVLKKMKRPYKAKDCLKLIGKLRSRIKDFSLTCDIMVGFPGEKEKNFQNTVRLLEAVRPLKAHIFPYSRREGTAAAGLKGTISDKEKKERYNRLKRLSRDISADIYREYAGRTLDVLIEDDKSEGDLMNGHTGNYLKVRFLKPSGGGYLPGTITKIAALKPGEDFIFGEILSS